MVPSSLHPEICILHGVLETALYVNDLDRARNFYSKLLGLEEHSVQEGRHVFFRCSQGMLLLFNASATSEPGHVAGQMIPTHGATGPGHVAFAIFESEIPRWRDHLTASGVTIESEISWPQGGHSIYFRDPAGNSLELATPKLWGLSEAVR